MHDCIIQLSKEPIDPEKNDFNSEDFNYSFDWFVPGIADYVADYDNEDHMKRCIKRALDCSGLRYENGKLIIISKEAYYMNKYEEFINIVRSACQWSLDDFISGRRWIEVGRLNDLYDDKFGTYVADSYHGLTTLDHFIRDCDNGDVFYIGDALDYHF